MAKFNYRELARAVATSPIGAKRVNTIMERKFETAKGLMMQEFEAHVVTRELEAGVGSPNISRTLDGEGNLTSFIGFPVGSAPVQPLRDTLKAETRMISSTRGSVLGNAIRYRFSLRIPTESVKRATPIPWESGNSWAEGIEKGISGFSNFLAGRFRSPKPSRSGGGRQTEEQVRAGTFKTRKYLSEIFTSLVKFFR